MYANVYQCRLLNEAIGRDIGPIVGEYATYSPAEVLELIFWGPRPVDRLSFEFSVNISDEGGLELQAQRMVIETIKKHKTRRVLSWASAPLVDPGELDVDDYGSAREAIESTMSMTNDEGGMIYYADPSPADSLKGILDGYGRPP